MKFKFLTQVNTHNVELSLIFILTKNHKTNSKGDVAMYIKNMFSYKHRPDLEFNIDREFESLFVEINNNNNKSIIEEIYRIPR